jgi:HAD superfamily hydrolase (TIGR01509 family)
MVIFDCNGVLVDSEPIANAVLADALTRAGFPMSLDVVARRFHGRRQADILSMVEEAAGRRLPLALSSSITAEILRRFRVELRPVRHVTHALAWLRGPKAVASSSTLDRIHLSLEVTDLLRFFQTRLFSASEVPKGKPAPDLYLLAAGRMQIEPSQCLVVEDSAPGITAAVMAGMRTIGFVGGSQAPGRLANDLAAAGARAVIADMRELKSTIIDLRGW